MLIHDPLGDRQTQAGSLLRPRLVRSVKAFKHMLHVSLRHTDPHVLHLQIYFPLVGASQAENDLISLMRILCRVIRQNTHRLFQKSGVNLSAKILRRLCETVDMLLIDHQRFLVYLLHHFVQICFFQGESGLPAVSSRQKEELFHQVLHMI